MKKILLPICVTCAFGNLDAQVQTIKTTQRVRINTGSPTTLPSTTVAPLQLTWHTPHETQLSQLLQTHVAEMTITLEAKSGESLTGLTFETYVNGRFYEPPVAKYGETGLNTGTMYSSGNGYSQLFTQKIYFPTFGRYKVDAQLKRNEQVIKRSAALQVDFQPEPVQPIRLCVLGIGPEQSGLRYNQADATDFVALFLTQSRLYSQVYPYACTGKKANTSGVLEQLAEIKRQNLTEKDMIIVFVSSHGTIINQNFYMQLSGFDGAMPDQTGLAWATIEKYLANVPCKKILFVDACKSGALDPLSGRKDADPTQLALAQAQQFNAKGGWTIFTSSNVEYSWEHADWKNGAFTEAILEALSGGKADANANKIVTIKELNDYLVLRVPNLLLKIQTKEPHFQLQYPQLKNLHLDQNLPLFEVR